MFEGTEGQQSKTNKKNPEYALQLHQANQIVVFSLSHTGFKISNCGVAKCLEVGYLTISACSAYQPTEKCQSLHSHIVSFY